MPGPPGAIGGTATTEVLVGGAAGGGAAGAPGPPGILIVGMPMIVAERGGIDAEAAAAAAAAGTGVAALPGDVEGAAGDAPAPMAVPKFEGWGAAAADDPGLATPLAALPTTSVTFSSIACVSHGLGRLASAPTWAPRTES